MAANNAQVCTAVIHCGPGHQSLVTCQRTIVHEIHQAVVSRRVLRWRGQEASTDYWDDADAD